MNFAYAYDTRGNIISETRNGLVTTYVYDALGQLIRVNDPHESATWVYNYDRGGNITSKVKYAYTTGTLGTAQQTIPYSYGDSNWKDKLTSYNGKTITYDAIGNPLNDGERTYTWGAGRQLRHISMPLTGVEHGFRVNHGVHAGSNTKLCIVRENSKLKARLLRDGRDVTTECAASAFVWKKNGSAAGTGKEIAVTTAEINGDVQFSCTYSETQGVYGTVSVNNNLVASHTPATADANHTFSLVNGMLNVEIPNSAGNGTDYKLTDGILSVNPGFTGSITAEYEFTTSPTREIDFKYNHNGLRTQKIVVENGVTTTYDYTLHGKLITHLTKRTVDENGAESTEELHFFYDAQSRPAFVEYDGAMYRYVHNLQGDIVAIVDTAGNLVVEYKYDAWGKPISTTGSLKTTLGELNPFRYRGYVYDMETRLYYLRSRYYNAERERFISRDSILVKNILLQSNLWSYCSNKPLNFEDPSGMKLYLIGDEQGYEILNHWLEGSGEELICDSDAWGEYMRDQKELNEIIGQEIFDAYKECMNNGIDTYSKKTTRSVELKKNSVLPYGDAYLHGTLYFHMTVNAQLDIQRNEFYFTVECEWEDTINPNYNYNGDKFWEKVAKSFYNPKDYKIRVRWICDPSNFWNEFKKAFEKNRGK